MNEPAWDILIQRIRASARQPTPEQIRVLAAVYAQVSSEVLDVLQIAADGIEGVDETEEDDA